MTTPAEPDLEGSSIGGALWFLAQTVVVKSSTIVTQLLLAYLLLPEDFGLIAVATSVAALAGTLFRYGLAQVLVERSPRTHDLASNSFALSMAMGAAAAVAVVALAPVGAAVVGEPEVRDLTWILALSVPLQSASVSPRARLLHDLEFGKVAKINGAQIVLRSALTVLFAWWGWGAASFAVAEVLASAVELWLYRRTHPLDARWPTDRSEWGSLTRDTGLLAVTGLLVVVVAQGDYFLLGVFASANEVGLYYFAYRLSIQGVSIFTANLGRVLFPALAQLRATGPRQHRAFLRSVRALAGVGVPIGVLGATLGNDLVLAVFDEDWEGAGVLFQILCVAAVVRTVTDAYTFLLTAQGRFRALLGFSVAITVTFLAVVAVGAWVGGATGVAVAVAAHVSVSGWVAFTLTIRPAGGTLGDLPKILVGPVTASALPAVVGLGLARWVGFEAGEWGSVVLPTCLVAVVYMPLLRIVSRPAADELSALGRYVIARARHRPSRHPVADRQQAGEEPEGMREA